MSYLKRFTLTKLQTCLTINNQLYIIRLSMNKDGRCWTTHRYSMSWVVHTGYYGICRSRVRCYSRRTIAAIDRSPMQLTDARSTDAVSAFTDATAAAATAAEYEVDSVWDAGTRRHGVLAGARAWLASAPNQLMQPALRRRSKEIEKEAED